MKNLTIARRYAKALILIGKEDGQAEIYREELAGVARLFANEKKLEMAICNPIYPADQRQKVLKTIIAKMQLSQVMASFLNLLFIKRRIIYLNNIYEFYQKLADRLKGIERASIISAIELFPETVNKISKSLAQMTGKEIILKKEVDPSLIGGVVTKIGDLVLDGSIKTLLLNMKESLKRGESI